MTMDKEKRYKLAMLEELQVRFADLDQEELDIACRDMAVFCISALRGIHGNQFIVEFLYAAMTDDLVLIRSKDSN